MLVDFPKLDGKIGKHMLMRGNKICLSADEFIKMPQSEIFFCRIPMVHAHLKFRTHAGV